jgi:hypothetical protein
MFGDIVMARESVETRAYLESVLQDEPEWPSQRTEVRSPGTLQAPYADCWRQSDPIWRHATQADTCSDRGDTHSTRKTAWRRCVQLLDVAADRAS